MVWLGVVELLELLELLDKGGLRGGWGGEAGDCRQAYPLKGCGNWAWWYLRLSRNNDSGVEAASNNCFGILKNSDRGE